MTTVLPTEAQEPAKPILNPDEPQPDPHYALRRYSPKLAEQMDKNYRRKYDEQDFETVCNVIEQLRKEFDKWDNLDKDSRLRLEEANMDIWGNMYVLLNRSSENDVKKKVFLYYDKAFQTDGKHLASVIITIPKDYFPYPEGYKGYKYRTTFFLTDNLWRLLERTDDPAVVSCIAVLILAVDSAVGYDEMKKKLEGIKKKSIRTSNDNLMLYSIARMDYFRHRFSPNFGLQQDDAYPKDQKVSPPQFGPPQAWLHSVIEEFRAGHSRKEDWIFAPENSEEKTKADTEKTKVDDVISRDPFAP